MIRTVLTPLNTDLHLLIPEDYVGKQIEILLFSVDEAEESGISGTAKTISDGSLTADAAWLKLSDQTLSDIWETPENEIWDEFYLKQKSIGNV